MVDKEPEEESDKEPEEAEETKKKRGTPKKKPEEPGVSKEKGSIEDVIANIKKRYGEDSIEKASKSKALNVERVPSGIYAIDKLTEGGWPLGRIVQIYGQESGGKTTTLLKSMANAQRFCKHCLKVRPDRKLYIGEEECKCAKPGNFETIYLDVEGVYDAEWSSLCGVDNDLVWVCRPSYAEQGLDILDGVVRESDANFVIVDTLTMLAPKEDIMKSTEDGVMALRARLINRTLRKLVAASNDQGMLSQRKMIIFLVCHVNIDIGGFRPMETKAGGKTKEFANSFELRFKKGKSESLDIGKSTKIECQVKKTKLTSTLGDIDSYELITKSTTNFKKGTVDESHAVFRDALELGIIDKDGKTFKVDPRAGFDLYSHGFTVQKDVEQFLVENRDAYESLKRFTLDYFLGKVE